MNFVIDDACLEARKITHLISYIKELARECKQSKVPVDPSVLLAMIDLIDIKYSLHLEGLAQVAEQVKEKYDLAYIEIKPGNQYKIKDN